MLERKIYQDIPGGKNSFHSAVLTSFSFNFHHFENQVLKSLKQKWITSVNVLVDQRMLDDVLGLSSSYLKTISKSYSVNGIESKGAFHPKINFFCGDERVLVIFGSGNITPGGHGKNHEIFSGFYADRENTVQLPLIHETWQYLLTIINQLDGYGYERLSKSVPSACSLINKFQGAKHQFCKIDESLDVALLYNDESSIFAQLCSLVPQSEVEKITVVCPYYDNDGATLINFKKQFPKAKLEVFLQEKFGLPPINIIDDSRIKFYDWNATSRGQEEISGKNPYERKLHGKLLFFKTTDFEYCLIGSANATKHGMGSKEGKAVNYEFSALYASSQIDFLNELGISGKKVPINVKKLERQSDIVGDFPPTTIKKTIRIKCADLNGSKLKIYLNKSISEDNLIVSVFNINGEECFSQIIEKKPEQVLEVVLNKDVLELDPKYCLITNNDQIIISNKQLINYLGKLFNTNPSEGNRNLRQLISSIDDGNFNEFEIAFFLNELELNSKTQKFQKTKNSGKGKDKLNEEIDASKLTYEEAILAGKTSSDITKIINSNPGSRIWAGLTHLFETNYSAYNEELMDEEEEGEAHDGRKRKVDVGTQAKVKFTSRNNAKQKLYSIEKMSENYIQSLKRLRLNNKHEIDIIDYHHFLLVSYLLTTVCCFTDYELPEDLPAHEWSNELDSKYRILMLEILKEFTYLCHQGKSKNHDSESVELISVQNDAKRKVIYHSILNLHLIQRKCNIPPIEDQIYLIGLNLLHYCSLPDKLFKEYIDSVSRNYQNARFSAEKVVSLGNTFVKMLEDDKISFVVFPSHGFCKIVSHQYKTYRMKSLYSSFPFTEKRMAELRSQSN